MDQDLLLAIALSESLMETNQNNNTNNNVEMKENEDKILIYLKDLISNLKRESVGKDLNRLVVLLGSKDLSLEQINFLSKILESVSFNLICRDKDKPVENDYGLFSKEALNFCIKVLDKWGSGEINFSNNPSASNNNSNNKNNSNSKSTLTPLVLLSIIDMLCCIEFPSSEVDKVFDNIPSFLNLKENELFDTNGQLKENNSNNNKNNNNGDSNNNNNNNKLINDNKPATDKKQLDDNIFNQFLSEGLSNSSKTITNKNVTFVVDQLNSVNNKTTYNINSEEGIETFVKINSNHFNNVLNGPSKLLSMCSKIILPYQVEISINSEKYESFKKDEYLYLNFINNVQDILFSEGFDSLDHLAAPWTIDFLSRLIGTLRTFEAFSIENQQSYHNSKLLSKEIFNNIFQVIGTKLNNPNLQVKAEVFFSLCILSDVERMNIDIVKILERSQDLPLEKEYLSINPQLIVLALELVFKNIKEFKNNTINNINNNNNIYNNTTNNNNNNNNNSQPISKFLLVEPIKINNNLNEYFDFTSNQQFSLQDISNIFIKPQFLDTIFNVLYLNYFKKSKTGDISMENVNISSSSSSSLSSSSPSVNNLSISNITVPIPINVNSNKTNISSSSSSKSPIGKSQDSYSGEDDIFGGLFQESSVSSLRNSNKGILSSSSSSTVTTNINTPKPKESTSNSTDIMKSKIYKFLSFINEIINEYPEFIKSNLSLNHLRILFALLSPTSNPSIIKEKSKNPILFNFLTNICFQLSKNSIINETLMDQFIELIFNQKGSEIFIIPKEQLTWLSWMFVKKQSNLLSSGAGNNSFVIKLWDGFLKSIHQLCKTSKLIGFEFKEVISIDYILLLMFSFNTLDEKYRLDIIRNFNQLIDNIVKEYNSTKFIPNSLIVSRCLMIFNYTLFNFDSVNPILSKLFSNQVLSFTKKSSSSTLSTLTTSLGDFFKLSIVNLGYSNTINQLIKKSAFISNYQIPEFYDLYFNYINNNNNVNKLSSSTNNISPINPNNSSSSNNNNIFEESWFNNQNNNNNSLEKISTILKKSISTDNSNNIYEIFYDNILTLCSLIPIEPTTQNGNSLDSLYFDYIITSSLKFLSSLPLSHSFLKAIKDPKTFETVNNVSPIYIAFLKSIYSSTNLNQEIPWLNHIENILVHFKYNGGENNSFAPLRVNSIVQSSLAFLNKVFDSGVNSYEIGKKMDTSTNDNGDSYFDGWESLFNDDDEEDEEEEEQMNEEDSDSDSGSDSDSDSDSQDSENDSNEDEVRSSKKIKKPSNVDKESTVTATKPKESKESKEVKELKVESKIDTNIIHSNISSLLPKLLAFIIDTLNHYKTIYKESLIKQLVNSNSVYVKLIEELYILSSNKTEIIDLMKSLGFSSEDCLSVEQWDEEYKPDSLLVSKDQKQLFSWSLQPFNATASGKVNSDSLQRIIKLLLSLSNQALIHWDNLNESSPELTKSISSKVSELLYEQVYISTDRSFSFLKDYYDNYSSLISGAQSGYLINQIKLTNFENISKVLVLPGISSSLLSDNTLLQTVLIGYVDSLISMSKLNGSHVYCHYISGFNGSVARGTRDFEFILPVGDLKVIIQTLFNNSCEKFNLKVLSCLVQFMSISTPPEFFTSFRSYVINIFNSISVDSLKEWFEQKLLGTIIKKEDNMEIDNNNNKIKSTINIQEQIIRLVGLLIGNKDLSSYSKDYLAQQAAAAIASQTKEQEEVEDSKKKKKTSGSSTPNKVIKKPISTSTPSSQLDSKTSSPALTASSNPPSLDSIDWDEKVSSFSQVLFDNLLSIVDRAFTVWIDQPKLIKGYFELLQFIAMDQHQLLKLFNQISNLSAPIIENPTINQLESLNLLITFIESILNLAKSIKNNNQNNNKSINNNNNDTEMNNCPHHHHHHSNNNSNDNKDESMEEDIFKDDNVDILEDEEDDEDQDFSEDEKNSNNESNANEEEDEERKLASKVCTFTFTKSDYIDQHWYFCYTCGLKFSEGCCSVCVKVCHKGHQVSYSRYSRFFCDCGAGSGKGTCKALKPRLYQPSSKPTTTSTTNSILSPLKQFVDEQINSTSSPQPSIPDSLSSSSSSSSASSSASISSVNNNSSINNYFFNLPTQQDKELLFNEIFNNDKSTIITKLSELYPRLIEMYKKVQNDLRPKQESTNKSFEIFEPSGSKEIISKTDIFVNKKTLKYGTFESKLKIDGSDSNQLKALINSGPIQRKAIASNSKGLLAIAEGDNVSLYHSQKILDDETSTLDKHSFKSISKSAVGFPIVSLVFNPSNDKFLAVVGFKECKILTINQKDEVVDQLSIDLSLDALGETIFIIKVEWIIGSQVELAVVTNEFIKIYDLSKDNLSPIHFYSLLEDSIRDMCLVSKNNNNFILALSNYGLLYCQAIEETNDNESCIMIETLQVPVNKTSAGVCLSYNIELDTIIASYNNGECYAFQTDDKMTTITRSFPIQDPNKKLPMPAQYFLPLSPNFPNMYACLAARGGFLLSFKINQKDISIQNIKLSPKVEGMTLLNRSSPKLLVLFDDGSLSRYDFTIDNNVSLVQPLIETAATKDLTNLDEKKNGLDLLLYLKSKYFELNESKLNNNSNSNNNTASLNNTTTPINNNSSNNNNKNNTAPNPVFPIDFFESTECITPNVKYGGDPLQWYSQDVIKQKLASNDEYIVCQSLDTLTLVIMNNNYNNAICGIRVLVGNASTKHIPQEIKVFNRSISIKEGQRRWYDIPFTNEESLKSIKKVTLTASSTYTLGNSPIIDQIEVYAKNKESFGFNDSDDEVEDFAENETNNIGNLLTSNQQEYSPIEASILHCLNSLKIYFSNYSNSGVGQYIKLKEKTLSNLPILITDSQLVFVRSSIKKILKVLSPDQDAYHTLKHSIQLKYASETIKSLLPVVQSQGGAISSSDIEKLDYLVNSIKKISSNNPKSLQAYLFNENPMFLNELLSIYRIVTTLANNKSNNNNGNISTVKLTNQQNYSISTFYSDHFISNLVELFWNCLQEKIFDPIYIFTQLKVLISNSNEIIRTRSSLKLSSLINTRSNKFISGNTVINNIIPDHSEQQQVHNPTDNDVQMVDEILFSCDICGISPIVEKRWNCQNCGDYDLCNNCYQNPNKDHPKDHQFVECIIDEPMKELDNQSSNTINATSTTPTTETSTTHDKDTNINDEEFDEDEDYKLAIAMSLGNDLPTTKTTSNVINVPLSPQDKLPSIIKNTIIPTEEPMIQILKLVLNEISSAYDKGFNYVLPYIQLLHSTVLHNGQLIISNNEASNLLASNLINFIEKSNNKLTNKYLSQKTGYLESDLLVFSVLSLLLDSDEQKKHKTQLKQPQQQQQQSSNQISNQHQQQLAQHSLSSSLIYQLSKKLIDRNIIQILLGWINKLFDCISSSSYHSVPGEGEKDSPFGALLVPSIDENHTLPKNRFNPFFGKHLPQSAFAIQTLISKSIFKLMITFYRCDRRKKTISQNNNSTYNSIIKTSEWSDIICSFIHSKKTNSIAKYPKKFLFFLYQTKSSYYSIRDEFLLKKKFSNIKELELSTKDFTGEIDYDRLAKLISYLTQMLEVASDRPISWQFFCSHNDVLSNLYRIVFNLSEEPSLLLLELLTYVFVDDKDEKQQKQQQTQEDTLMEDIESSKSKHISIFLDEKYFDILIYNILLESNSSDLRTVASNLIYHIWKCSTTEQRVFINKSLWSKFNNVASYGKNANEYMELLTYFVNETNPELWKDQFDEFTTKLINSFKLQNQISINHPNSQIYNSLGKILEFDGYYLESDPCLVCNNPEVQYQTLRLDLLKQEVKFSESSQLIKFNGVYNISKILIQLHDLKKGKMIKTINLFYNNKPVSDIGDLKGKFNQWKKLKQVHFAPSQTEKSISFQIPISARNFMIEYFDFHDNQQVAATEKLQCPRCSRIVTDKHGICKNCHENAYQCKHCRNINYENLDAFLCNECGFCKHAKFEYSFTVKPTIAIEKIENQEDHKRAIATIEKESENAHKKYQRLIGFKKVISNLVTSFETQEPWSKDDLVSSFTGASGISLPSSTTAATSTTATTTSTTTAATTTSATSSNNQTSFITLRINKKIGYLSRLYERECKSIFEALSRSVQILSTNRTEISKYINFISNKNNQQSNSSTTIKPHIREENKCYGCSCSFIEQTLCFILSISRNQQLSTIKDQLISKGLAKEIFFNNIHNGKSLSKVYARSSISYLCKSNSSCTNLVNNWIKDKIMYTLENYSSIDVPNMISSEISLLKDLATLPDNIWESRFSFIMNLFFKALSIGSHNPIISEFIILPTIKIIIYIVTLDRSGTFTTKDQIELEKSQKVLSNKFEKLKSMKQNEKIPIDSTTASTTATNSNNTTIINTTIPSTSINESTTKILSPTSNLSSSSSSSSSSNDNNETSNNKNETSNNILSMFENDTSNANESWDGESGSDQSMHSSTSSNQSTSSINTSNNISTNSTTILDIWSQKYENYLLNFTTSLGNNNFNNLNDNDKLLFKYFRKWLNQIKVNKLSGFEQLFEEQWLGKLLFNSTSSIRLDIITLMGILSKTNNIRTLKFLDLLTKMIPQAMEAGEYSAEFFGLFNSFIQNSPERKIYLAVKNFIPYICDLIIKEIDSIKLKENSFNTDISQGFVLKILISILKSFLEVPNLKNKMKKDNIMEKVLDAFLSLRGVIVQKNKLTEDSVKYLQELMKSLNSESVEDNKKFMAANIKALSKYQNDGRTPIFIFEQLCNIVCPTKPEPIYQLILFKASSQEEYIRGSMNRNPYASNTIGPLMRDVKNKICKTLDLGSFLDDDNGMELLVDNKIIKLDLPIRKVYEQVWKRSAQAQRSGDIDIPMNVIYRLQGLDGEATEEIIETLNDNNSEEKDPEVEFEITSVMAECNGLDAMIKTIEQIKDFSIEKELAQLVIKLLYHCCKIKVNRQKLLTLNTVGRLLEKLKLVFQQPDLSEHFLVIIESVVSEANRDYLRGSNSSTNSLSTQHHKGIKEAQEQMTMFLDKLDTPNVCSNPKIIQAMTRIIPFLTYGHKEVMGYLVDFFTEYLNFEEYDQSKNKDSNYTKHLEFFSKVLECTRPDSNGSNLRSLILERGITQQLIDYLLTHFPEDKDKTSQEWLDSLEKPSLPYVLVLFRGLTTGHEPTQNLAFKNNLIRRIHILEETSTSAKIGSLAENLLETIAESNKDAAKAISDIRKESKSEKLKQAEKHREGVLKELGLAQQGKHIMANFVPSSIEDLEEDEGFTCMVCREGYSFKPDDVLGIYTFSKKIPLQSINETTISPTSSSTSGALSFGFTTVTHFNFIHFYCHRDAAKADRCMKVPKEEWEGAALRNQQTKCNGLLPIIPPKMLSDTFAPYSDKFWSNLNSISRIDGPRFRILVHDLKFLFIRLSKDESFSVDSKGGGKESNIRIAPFMIQLGMFLLDQKLSGGNASNQLRRPQFDKFLNQFTSMTIDTAVVSMNQMPSDNCPYYLVMSIFLLSPKEWENQKFNFLNKLLCYAFVEYIGISSKNGLTTPEEPSNEKLFDITRNWFIFFSLVNKFHEIIKPSSLKMTDNWIQETKNYLSNSFTKIQNDVKELLNTYENELKEFVNQDEFLDDLDLFKNVLSEHKDTYQYLLKNYKYVKSNK